jgi:hypothetical protein
MTFLEGYFLSCGVAAARTPNLQTTTSHVLQLSAGLHVFQMLQYALLWVFHLFLALKRFVASLLPRRQPQVLRARRRKLPAHLAVLLCSEKNIKSNGLELPEALESVRRLVSWCQSTGITTLSIFDEAGKLRTYDQNTSH